MIKLFRNIRKKLIAEGKTTNYLKFTVGEIDTNPIRTLFFFSSRQCLFWEWEQNG
jgi:hypothetical protein